MTLTMMIFLVLLFSGACEWAFTVTAAFSGARSREKIDAVDALKSPSFCRKVVVLAL